MYKHILVPLENSPTDAGDAGPRPPAGAVLRRALTLVHVADGFVARNQRLFNLAESRGDGQGPRIPEAQLEDELAAEGHEVVCVLAQGEPADGDPAHWRSEGAAT